VRTEADQVILIYKHRSGSEEWKVEQYPVRIVRTRCNPWRLAGMVHLPDCQLRAARGFALRRGIFTCRHCARLGYACERESGEYRVTGRGNRIRQQLGWDLAC
jgi:hypothetical protein